MFDIEKFIGLVKKRPSIWNTRAVDYYRRNKKKTLDDWDEVAAIMIPSWSKLSSTDKQIKGKELVSKWKHIKDNFRKDLKVQEKIKLGAARAKKKRYVHSDLLAFLRPIFEKGSYPDEEQSDEEQNEEEQNEEEENEEEPNGEYRIKIKESSSEDEAFEIPIGIETSTVISEPAQPKRIKIQNESTDRELLEILQKKFETDSKFLQDDDTLFLLSLAPTLKKMTPSRKLRAKIEIMTAIENNLNHDDPLALPKCINRS